MSNEIVAQESAALMSIIERVASDPNSDITKLEKMLDMQERVLNRNAEQQFTADMAAMQAEMPRVYKLASGHNTTYARLEDINDTIRPVLQKYGFAVTFNINQNESRLVKITAILSHRGGYKQDASILLPLDVSGKKNDVQSVGSTITYGRRYALCTLLNISTGDDTNGFKLGENAATEAATAAAQKMALPKSSITDDRFSAGLEKIKEGAFTIERMLANYELTKEQHNQLAALEATIGDVYG